MPRPFCQSPLRIAVTLAAVLSPAVDPALRAEEVVLTRRISVATDGTQGDEGSTIPQISADERFVAFQSKASTLVAGDTNNTFDAFVRDLDTRVTSRVSISSTGAQANSGSYAPVISGDGRYVAFHSDASNLVAGDTNGRADIFVHDRETGETTRASIASDGTQSDDFSQVVRISDDGRYVLFESAATNLVPDDTNGTWDIFLRDRTAETTERISVAADGTEANGLSHRPEMTPDARFIAFISRAANLVPGDAAGDGVYLVDRQADTISKVSVTHDGSALNNVISKLRMSADASVIAFETMATNVVPGDTNGKIDIFAHDRTTGTSEWVSVSADGVAANNHSFFTGVNGGGVSGDGRLVVFESLASNFVPDDTDHRQDVYVRDRIDGTLSEVSVTDDGQQTDAASLTSAVSRSGRLIAYASWASNLVPGDTNSRADVFLIDFGLAQIFPRAGFEWDLASPSPGDTVTFTDRSRGEIDEWSWSFGDGSTSTLQNPSHAFSSAGFYDVELIVTNAYFSNSETKTLYVGSGDSSRPMITGVTQEYSGFFLERSIDSDGNRLTNLFSVGVAWPGGDTTDAQVCVAVTDPRSQTTSVYSETGTASGATHVFDMVDDFEASLWPSTVAITAVYGSCASPTSASDPANKDVYVFPYPHWLELVAVSLDEDEGLEFAFGDGEVEAGLRLTFPKPPLSKSVTIPDYVPYLGGELGLDATYGWIDGHVFSRPQEDGHNGKLALGGQTTFEAMGQALTGWASGAGTFLLRPPKALDPTSGGLELTSASFTLGLAGTLSKEMGVVEAIPQLAALASYPGIKQFNQRAKLRGELEPSIELTASFIQQAEEGTGDKKLVFDEGSGTLGLGAKVTMDVDLVPDMLTASPYVSGGGSLTLGVPATAERPLIRELRADLEVGMEFKINYLLGTLALTPKCPATCSWTPGSAVACSNCRSESGGSALTAVDDLQLLAPIEVDYASFGPYSRLASRPLAYPATRALPEPLAVTSVFDNVFPGASPQLLEIGSDTLLLWVHQDSGDPVLQSTEIAWAVEDAGGWSAMSLVADDTQVELSPVAAVDADGEVVVVWLRVKSPAFVTPVESFDDLPGYFRELEVVSAVFDPVLRTWSTVVSLTDDTAFDSNPVLSSDGAGSLLLTWLSNDGGALLSTAAQPSVLKYSLWDAASGAWSAPATAATGLVGVSSHAAAYKGTNAFVMLSVDPDAEVTGDAEIRAYSWNGTTWSGPTTFATGGGDHHQPRVVYDAAGEGHVVWVVGQTLCKGTLTAPTPVEIRQGSGSLAFYDTRLFTNPDGNITLLWQEGVENGPSEVFAMLFDPVSGTWSRDGRLTFEEETKHYSLSGFYGGDNVLRVAHLATLVERVDGEVEIDGEVVTIPNLPVDGRTDLRMLEHELVIDLAVGAEDIEVFPFLPEPGEDVTLAVRIHNIGDLGSGAFDVEVYAGEPGAGGVLVGIDSVAAPFAGRDRVELEFAFTYPESGGNLYVVIDAAAAVSEYRKDNNLAQWAVTAGSSDNDVAVYDLENEPPVALVVASTTAGVAPLSVDFDGSPSFDPEGEALSFFWTYADGSPSVSGVASRHTFDEPGRFPVVLAVADPKGRVGTATARITVFDPLFEDCYFARDLMLTDLVVTTPWRYEACRSITAATGFSVAGGGEVVLAAGSWVALDDGFSVAADGRLTVAVGP